MNHEQFPLHSQPSASPSEHQATKPNSDEARCDVELLKAFVEHGDQQAMTEIITRHGSMVMSVCRSVLRNEHDASDAFQATFLVLLKKAPELGKLPSLAGWLYSVAHRVAERSRLQSYWRQKREGSGIAMVPATSAIESVDEETVSVIHEELRKLPESLRLPLIMCCLEGESREKAAAQLGWTLGSLKGRLERGREQLLARLKRRGVVLPAAALTAVLTQQAMGAVPAVLASSTVSALTLVVAGQPLINGVVSVQTAALTQGVLKSMFIMKLKISSLIVIALGLATSGITFLARHVMAAPPAAQLAQANQNDAAVETELKVADTKEKSQPKTFVVFPVETELQKKCLVDDNAAAYVYLDGEAAIAGNWHTDGSRVPFILIRKALIPYARADKSVLLIAAYKGMQPTSPAERETLGTRLTDLGEQAGFKRGRAGYSFKFDKNYQETVTEISEKMDGRSDEAEPASGDALAKVYPVRTRLSSLLSSGADCVVDVLVTSAPNGDDLLSPEVRKSIAKSVSEAKLRNKNRLMICINTTTADRDRFGRFYQGPGTEFAKSLGFENLITYPKY